MAKKPKKLSAIEKILLATAIIQLVNVVLNLIKDLLN